MDLSLLLYEFLWIIYGLNLYVRYWYVMYIKNLAHAENQLTAQAYPNTSKGLGGHLRQELKNREWSLSNFIKILMGHFREKLETIGRAHNKTGKEYLLTLISSKFTLEPYVCPKY